MEVISMKSVLFIIGNGFNFFICEYLKNPVYTEIIEKKIMERQKLGLCYDWIPSCTKKLNEYCYLLDDISFDNLSGEFLLSEISSLYKKLDGKDELEELNNAVIRSIQSKIEYKTYSNKKFTNIAQTVRTIFNQYENKKTMLSFAITLYDKLKAFKFENAYIYTTNYDKIVDEVFKDLRDAKPIDVDIVDLHGDYKSEIVCCAPFQKENKIDKNIMNTFKQRLEETEIIVLFGLGLTSDPHILSAFNKQKNKNIIIIDYSKIKYFENKNKRSRDDFIGYDFIYDNNIYFLSTGEFDFVNNKLYKPIETPEEFLERLLENINNIKFDN
jgi:hypothetical protein